MRKHILMLALAAASLASCKKEKTDITGPGPAPGGSNPDPVPTAKMLKKITSTTDGQSTTYVLTYNGTKLLTSVKSTDNSDVTNFSYDNAGNVTRVESTDADFHNIYEYVYEDGIPARGTFKSYDRSNGVEELIEDDVIHYTVENGKVTHINMDMVEQQQEVNFALTYNNSGNLTKVEGENGMEYTATFTYGSKKPIFPKVFKFVMDHAGYSVQFFAKNDLTTQQYDFPGTDYDFTNTMQHTYDANGYVLTSTDGSTTLTYEYQ